VFLSHNCIDLAQRPANYSFVSVNLDVIEVQFFQKLLEEVTPDKRPRVGRLPGPVPHHLSKSHNSQVYISQKVCSKKSMYFLESILTTSISGRRE
jgi:hypothetical protein